MCARSGVLPGEYGRRAKFPFSHLDPPVWNPTLPHAVSGLSGNRAHAGLSLMIRKTTQREVIREVFSLATGPLGPREVLAMARAQVEMLGLATVYRAIRHLVDCGELVAVDIPGEPPRYELAGIGHHHHFHCRTCRKVFCVPGCQGVHSPAGFAVEKHEISLEGVCRDCLKQPGTSPASTSASAKTVTVTPGSTKRPAAGRM